MTPLLTILLIICTIGAARHSLDLKDKYAQKIRDFDVTFSSIARLLTRKDSFEALDIIANLFGIIAASSFFLFLMATYFFGMQADELFVLVATTIYSLFVYFSVKWFTKADTYSLKMLSQFLLISFGFLLIPILDLLFGHAMTYLFYEQLDRVIFFVNLPETTSIVRMGFTITFLLLASTLTYWGLMTLICSVVFLSGLLLTKSLLMTLLFAEKICGEKMLTPICYAGIFVFALLTNYGIIFNH